MNTPNLDKQSQNWDFIFQVTEFLEWLEQEKSIGLKYADAHNNPPVNVDNLIYEYFDIDPAGLERERQAILKAQQEQG